MNWFAGGGAEYAAARPDYPADVVDFLAQVTGASADRAVTDVGCGTGQFTRQLASRFGNAVGVDPSLDQLRNAPRGDGAPAYVCGAAERIPVADGCAALVTAAQSAHWFELAAFWGEVRRIAADGAVVALVTYGLTTLRSGDTPEDGGAGPAPDPTEARHRAGATASDPHRAALADRFDRFYCDEIGPYWPPERAHVADGYRNIAVPFDEIRAPHATILRQWDLDDLLRYVLTWSAVRAARSDGEDGLVQRFIRDMTASWGPPEQRRPVRWPVRMRVARVG